MRTLAKPNLLCFSFGIFDLPTIAQHSANHPESADANRRGAMNEGGPVRRVVGDLQKLIDLFVFRLAKSDWNVEVAQTQLFGLRCFFLGAMFGRPAEIDDCFNAFGLQFFKMLQARLSAGAELLVDAHEVSDRTGIG